MFNRGDGGGGGGGEEGEGAKSSRRVHSQNPFRHRSLVPFVQLRTSKQISNCSTSNGVGCIIAATSRRVSTNLRARRNFTWVWNASCVCVFPCWRDSQHFPLCDNWKFEQGIICSEDFVNHWLVLGSWKFSTWNKAKQNEWIRGILTGIVWYNLQLCNCKICEIVRDSCKFVI